MLAGVLALLGLYLWFSPSFESAGGPDSLDDFDPAKSCKITDGTACGAYQPEIAASADGSRALVVWPQQNPPDRFVLVGRLVGRDAKPLRKPVELWGIGADPDVYGRVRATSSGGFRISWDGLVREVDAKLEQIGRPIRISAQQRRRDSSWRHQDTVAVLSDGVKLTVYYNSSGVFVTDGEVP